MSGARITEAKLKAEVRLRLERDLPGCVAFRLEDRFTSGVPDIAITWAGATAWCEVKWLPVTAKVGRISRGAQDFACAKLAEQGLCATLVFMETAAGGLARPALTTWLVSPSLVARAGGQAKDLRLMLESKGRHLRPGEFTLYETGLAYGLLGEWVKGELERLRPRNWHGTGGV